LRKISCNTHPLACQQDRLANPSQTERNVIQLCAMILQQLINPEDDDDQVLLCSQEVARELVPRVVCFLFDFVFLAFYFYDILIVNIKQRVFVLIKPE
jgi:hypothetical protein